MRLLVAPHDLTIGGSQINAVDLAAGVAQAGHDVTVYGVPGPLVDRVEQRGLRFIPARRLRYRPAPSRIAQLAMLARRHQFDLIHAYEWPPCLDVYFGAHLALGVPLMCTVLSMSVSPLVPRSVPLVMGTDALADEARQTQRAPVWVLEPPIDTETDHPGIDGLAFRRSRGIADEEKLVVTVSRLAIDLKLDALVDAIDAADLVAASAPVRLVIVGDGRAEGALRARAEVVNARHGREVVGFAGLMADPRPAYAAADVVVGMGSSALRALSIGRAVVVQGERGFAKPFEPNTLPYFLRHGFWGRGEGKAPQRLAGELGSLLADPYRRAALGAFGRQTVEDRFSLARTVNRQIDIYAQVVSGGRRADAAEAVRAARRAVQLERRAHDPRLKRARRDAELSRLAAASTLQGQAVDV